MMEMILLGIGCFALGAMTTTAIAIFIANQNFDDWED